MCCINAAYAALFTDININVYLVYMFELILASTLMPPAWIHVALMHNFHSVRCIHLIEGFLMLNSMCCLSSIICFISGTATLVGSSTDVDKTGQVGMVWYGMVWFNRTIIYDLAYFLCRIMMFPVSSPLTCLLQSYYGETYLFYLNAVDGLSSAVILGTLLRNTTHASYFSSKQYVLITTFFSVHIFIYVHFISDLFYFNNWEAKCLKILSRVIPYADYLFTLSISTDKPGPIYDFDWSPSGNEFVVVYGLMPAKGSPCMVLFEQCLQCAFLLNPACMIIGRNGIWNIAFVLY